MAKYSVHQKHRNRETLITTIGERAVNLMGKPAKKEVPASEAGEAYTVEIPAATQEDLRAVYLRGDKDKKGDPIVIMEPASPSKKEG